MTDPGQDFARLMVAQSQGAAAEPPQPKSYGMTRDKATGQVRQKKAAGRPRKAPVADPDLTTVPAPNQDPDPGWMHGDAVKLPAPQQVSQEIKDDMAGFFGFAIGIVGPPIVSIDPYCGQALIGQADAIASAAVPLMCKSATLVKFFSSTDNEWLLWLNLGKALFPVAQAIVKHHVTKTVQVVEHDGDKYAVPADFSGFTTQPAEAA